MDELKLPDLNELLKSKQLNYYNIYNADISISQYYTADYYINHPEDTIDKPQTLSKVFTDIECFSNNQGFEEEDFNKSTHPISAISFYSSKLNKYKTLFLFNNTFYNKIPDNLIDLIKSRIIEDKYLTEIDYEIEMFNSEEELLHNYWKYIREIDPVILSGYNSDNFDYPYIYNRVLKLNNNNKRICDSIVSRFAMVTQSYSGVLNIPEYTIADILYLMKPRDEGGLNYGKKQDIYSLHYVAKKILGITKYEYEGSLDDLYLNKPIDYIYYNLIDVILCKLLDDKFQHIHLHNIIRRLIKCNYSSSLHGVSLMYDSFILYQLQSQNKYIRYAINTEKGLSIDKSQFSNLPVLKTKKTVIPAITITPDNFRTLTSKYTGAYVKTPKPKIINDGSLIIDLDASLPPWEKIYIKRNDIIYLKNIGDYIFQENDKTLTWDDNNNICWKKVLNKIEHHWNGNLILITTKTNNQINVTDNHSIFGIKKGQTPSCTNIIDAKNLKIGDYVVTYNDNNITKLEEIIKITIKHYTGKVYDISVEETERFFGGTGIGAHNSSLYPSMILQHNISFDVFTGILLNPPLYKLLLFLETNTGKKLPDQICQNVYNYITSHVDSFSYQNKNQATTQLYYLILYLMQKILAYNIPLYKIYNPTNDTESILLKLYLLPLLDLLNTIHPNSTLDYNNFIYDYLFNDKDLATKYPILYIIHNPFNSNSIIYKFNFKQALEYMNNYCFTINGCFFNKHEEKLGIFTNIIKDLMAMRKSYKKERDSFTEGSDKYDQYDKIQSSVKVATNSIYGIFGLSTFRYSSHHLAQSITSQGKLINKIAQHIADQHLILNQ